MVKLKIRYFLFILFMAVLYKITGDYTIFYIGLSLFLILIINALITFLMYIMLEIKVLPEENVYRTGDIARFNLEYSTRMNFVMGLLEIKIPLKKNNVEENVFFKKVIVSQSKVSTFFEFNFLARGVYQIDEAEIKIKGLIPIIIIKKKIKFENTIFVYPRIFDLKTISAKNVKNDYGKNISGFNTNDIFSIKNIREYISGDSIKNISWKASAKRNKLMVKEYEAKSDSNLIIIIDMSIDDPNEHEEKLISAALSVSAKLLSERVNHYILINSRKNIITEIKSESDFKEIEDFFVKTDSGCGHEFSKFLKDSITQIRTFSNIYIFTLDVNEYVIKNVHSISKRKNLILFHLNLNMRQALSRYGIRNISADSICEGEILE